MDQADILSDIRAARDSGGFARVADAVQFIRNKGENKIGLSNGFEMRFHHQFRGFVVIPDTSKSLEFHLICPVVACEGYFGGGQKCVHFQEFIDGMNDSEATNDDAIVVNEKFIRSVMEKIWDHKTGGLGSYINALNTLEKNAYVSAGGTFVATRFNSGMSVRVKFLNGSSFFTCGEGGCYKKAENLNEGSFYCSTHIKDKQKRTNPKTTLNAFKNAFKSLAYRHDPTVDANCISTRIWAECLADIYERDEFKHAFEGCTVFIQLFSNGQLIYENANKKVKVYKCPLPNCLMSTPSTMDAKGKPVREKLCAKHKNEEAALIRLVADVKKLVGERKEDTSSFE